MTADESKEFVQIVRVKLFENDYAIIRKFEGRSSFSTYATTVIMRLFHQWRIEQWGKWRPSAKAKAAERPSEDSAEERVRARERESVWRTVVAVLDRAIRDSSPEDRLILQLRFRNGMKAPEIARIVNLEPKKVYKRLERLLKTLRQAFEDAEIDPAAVDELMGQQALDLSLGRAAGVSLPGRPPE